MAVDVELAAASVLSSTGCAGADVAVVGAELAAALLASSTSMASPAAIAGGDFCVLYRPVWRRWSRSRRGCRVAPVSVGHGHSSLGR
jgi:hypothetical protein